MRQQASFDSERAKIGVGDVLGLVLIAGAVTIGLLWFS